MQRGGGPVRPVYSGGAGGSWCILLLSSFLCFFITNVLRDGPLPCLTFVFLLRIALLGSFGALVGGRVRSHYSGVVVVLCFRF